MTETIIISNLHKNDFVAAAGSPLSLANHIKLAILNLPPCPGQPDYASNISHYSELPFLSRIIIIFKTELAASEAYRHLLALQQDGATPFSLPQSAKLSLQENLLSRSKSTDDLEESELNVREDLERFRSKHLGKMAAYQEPAPEKVDMYQDLLRSGIDITKYNSEKDVREFEEHSKMGDSASLGRSRSVTKTLFKPSLKVGTQSPVSADSVPPPSPIITLDETF